MAYSIIKDMLRDNKIQKRLPLVVITLLLVISTILVFTPKSYSAADAALTFTPSTGTFNIYDTITITIKANGGTNQFNAIEADVSYNTATLEYISTKYSSNFGLTINAKTSGGVVCSAAGSANLLSGEQSFATMTFKAKSSGTASLSFVNGPNSCNSVTSGGSAIVNPSGNVWNRLANPANFSIKSPPPPDTTTTTTMTTTNNTSSPSRPNTPTSSNTSTTPTQSSTSSESEKIKPTSYIAIKVVDSEGKIIVGAKVTIDGKYTAVSDATGIASFSNIPEGRYSVKTESGGKTTTQFIDVKGATSAKPQEYSIKLSTTTNKETSKWLTYVAVLLGVILLIALIIFYKRRKKKLEFYSDHNMDKIDFDKPSNETTSSTIQNNLSNSTTPPAGTVIDPNKLPNEQVNNDILNKENSNENE
jgi:LPXTG-motif cell wall-anchored protein